ncbi:conserved hypothetical protein [Trichinella spiralis]|uniref:hypothetical protein n=1 Tax=Trichinella spiralis TaxID=6334 RepID=UPI0001EFB4F9|nr:conserved hypothetical protein [Trichinella spiralis]
MKSHPARYQLEEGSCLVGESILIRRPWSGQGWSPLTSQSWSLGNQLSENCRHSLRVLMQVVLLIITITCQQTEPIGNRGSINSAFSSVTTTTTTTTIIRFNK